MMRRKWFTVDELWEEALPGLPRGKVRLRRFVEEWFHNDSSWQVRETNGRTEYNYCYLPDSACAILIQRYLELPLVSPDGPHAGWEWYNALPRQIKDDALLRLKAVCFWFALGRWGFRLKFVTEKFGVSPSSMYRWVDKVRGYPEQDFLVLLAAERGTKNAASKAAKK